MSFLRKSVFHTIKTNTYCTNVIKPSNISKKVCVVGAGPAGFYAAQYLLKHLGNCEVHLLEKLPVPFGLVRFGVAPDHPEVKNVINTFTKTAENKNFKYYGNFELGKNCSLKDLRQKYHAVILTYGADCDKKLNIPNENAEHVLSARDFVAWYNGLPRAEKLNPNLKVDSVSIIGQGNVAIDVARILLSPIDLLKHTDITNFALEALSDSKIRRVNLIGRRGPMQAAFTIKELREMLKLPNANTVWRKVDFEGVREQIPDLQRPRKRLIELMVKSLDESRLTKPGEKEFVPIFLRSPLELTDNGVKCCVNKMKAEKAVATEEQEFFDGKLILRSIGYKSVSCDNELNFDEINGCVVNESGRVFSKALSQTEGKVVDKGLYAAGWLATGPTGVILSTMNGAFLVAKTVCDDINSGKLDISEMKEGLNVQNQNIVTWDLWKKIDSYETEEGKKCGKPREKIISIDKMLNVAGF